MANGYTGKVLRIDLTSREIKIDQPNEAFYRTYLGGPGFGLYYLLTEMAPQADALGPDNIIVFAAGLLTGTAAPSVPRFTVCAKSPLTGALGRSEAGGWWGPELKLAGFDAVVVRGRAEKPVYLWINQGKVEIRDAEHVWGKETGTVERIIKDELQDNLVRIAQIGPAGENQVKYAAIVNELVHFNGRSGLGAVMGSKNLKAIAVRGNTKVSAAHPDKLKELAQWVAQEAKVNPLSKMLHSQGTPAVLTANNAAGGLPSCNWQYGSFDEAEEIGGDKLTNDLLFKRGSCFACPIRCKRVVKASGNVDVDPKYGGPEYETMAALGSNCGVKDLTLICKANELCNKYGMDSISTGAVISFAMECYDKEYITREHTGGLDLQFGDGNLVLDLIQLIACRDGFGDWLAEGTVALAKRIGNNSERLLMQVKGQDAPMHDPRLKNGLALQYALSPIGADHWFAQHDPFFVPGNPIGQKAGAPLGILEGIEAVDFSWSKVRLIFYTSMLNCAYDGLGVCVFGFAARSVTPLNKLLEMVEAITGWDTSLWELMKAGERINNMARMFNCREGFGPEDDSLPARLTQPLASGPYSGHLSIDALEFREAVDLYYDMAGWDSQGRPTRGKLLELGLNWLTVTSR